MSVDQQSEQTTARRLSRGWPLAVAFLGYPVWWILGVGEFVLLAAAACLGYELLRRRDITAPRGFGWWILFLVWVVAGVAVMQVDAPGGVPGSSSNRYFVWAYRLAWFVAATVVLLYVGNTRRHLSNERLTRIMSWMFVIVVVGGLVGTVAKSVTFPSLLEAVLPHSISSIGFVSTQIHPTLAQVYDVRRPSAPFPYANEWGLNFAVFLPFFVGSWCRREAGWRRIVAPFVLAVAVIPVIYSLNRGLWLTLAVMALFVAARSAATGHFRLLGALLVGAIAVAALLTASPLKGTLETRVSAEDNSNQGRTNLVALSLSSMAERSPVVGYGSTRNVQGTFGSISGGATVSCPLCSPPAMGTQGLLWLVAFTTGAGGLLMFLGFLVTTFVRHLRLSSGDATVGLSVLVALFVTLPIYDLSGPALFAVMAAIGLLWRTSMALRIPAGSNIRYLPSEPTLRRYGARAAAHGRVIVTCVLVGIVAGAGGQAWRGSPPTASVSLLVPTATPLTTLAAAQPEAEQQVARSSTLDTEAQLADAQAVVTAVQRVVRATGGGPVHDLAVSATANSRVLHLGYTARTAATATAVVRAAANAYLQSKIASLRDEQALVLHSLRVRSTGLTRALAIMDRHPHGSTTASRLQRQDLMTQLGDVAYETQQVRDTPLEPGEVISAVTVHVSRDGWLVSLTSGAMLGLLAGATWSRLRIRRLPVRSTARTVSLDAWPHPDPVYPVTTYS